MTLDDDPLKPARRDAQADGAAVEFRIGPEDAGARLDKWLADEIAELTRTRLKALIEGGALTKNGQPFADPSWKLRAGETLRLLVPDVEEPAICGEAIPLEIVHEDEAVIVIDKPAGMVVHPAAGNWTGTLVNALIHHCGESLSGIGGVARPGIVHRIDKDTSGLLVVAKTDAAHQGLTRQFAAHDIERVYLAVAVGAPRPGVGTVDAALARSGGDRKKMAVVNEDDRDDARHAVTHYRTLAAYGRDRAKLKGDALAALLECRLETGRTHQIRVHLASIGHPLVGDPVYGRGPGLAGLSPGDPAADAAIARIRKFRRQALHAAVLGFEHPITGQALSFKSPLPDEMEKLIAALDAL